MKTSIDRICMYREAYSVSLTSYCYTKSYTYAFPL